MPSSLASNHLDTPLTDDELTQFDERLAHIGEHSENGLSLEGVDGFITALLCGPRLVMPSEYLPVLLGEAWMEVFSSADELEAFMSLFSRRWNQIAHALNAPVDDLSDPDALAPLIMDWEGLLADLPEDERERVEAEGVPPYASVWAAGFLLAVEYWEDDWLLPEGSQDETFVDELLDPFYILIEPPEDLTPEERELSRDEYVAMAIWSAYDLLAFWQDRGSAPRTPFKKAPEPGRNDPCPCGSGKKFKKCCGAADKLH